MESILLLIAVLACPLVMLAMGAIAWVTAKAFGRRSDRTAEQSHGAVADAVGR